jgi:hypothetical protein
MNTADAIRRSIEMGQRIALAYLNDLTDGEMMHRPHPDCNHIKWQLGHLIQSENGIINSCLPGALPDLPEGFADRYNRSQCRNDDPSFFDSKAELMELFQRQRAATLAALEKCSDADLDKPTTGKVRNYAPTWGDAFLMQDSHWVMHAGQWAVIRRQLGKPALF